jgi:RimJ/RimL family protein N-acetyltransferase/predicted N-acetyltransferase YhbS
MQSINIRPATPADTPALTALATRAKAHWHYPPAQLDAWRDALTITADSLAASPTWVAEGDGRIAGFYQLKMHGDSWALEHLWVDPAWMRRGIGRALFAHARDVAVERGAVAIGIDADPNAEPFYLACGAARIGAIAAPIDGMPDRARPQLVLATGLSAPDGDVVTMRGIATERLQLEPQTAAHADEMFAVLSDLAIYEYENAPPPSREWLRTRYEKLAARQSPDGQEQWLNWVVRLRGDVLIGYVQATIYPEQRAGIAYEFASRFWGQGLAGEAVQAMIEELAGRHQVKRFSAVLKRKNLRSLGLLQRLDFVPGAEELYRRYRVDDDEILMLRVLKPAR